MAYCIDGTLNVSLLTYRISSGIRGCFYPFQNGPKYPDPSYKMDLDIWDCV